MNRKQKIIVSITGIFIVLLALVGLTYAYFLTQITGNENEKSISVTTANLQLLYEDDTNQVVTEERLMPSNTVYTKSFTVKNQGNANIDYGVYLINVINTFERKDDIKYTMECTTNGTLPCGAVATETTFPSGISELSTATIEPNKTHTYTFKFTYKDSGTDQSVDMNKKLEAKIQIFGESGDGTILPYEEGTLAYNIINRAKSSLNDITLVTDGSVESRVANEASGENERVLAITEDDYGTSYYFRGNVQNNYVTFADMCWRIVRIKGNGNVKLILEDKDNTCEEMAAMTSTIESYNNDKGDFDIANKVYGYIGNDNYQYYSDYLGYAGGMADEFKNYQTTLAKKMDSSIGETPTAEQVKNTLASKLEVGEWCLADKAYSSSSADVSTATPLTEAQVNNKITNYQSFYYDSYVRLYGRNPKEPTLKCNGTTMSKFRDNTDMYVGTLTADEIAYAGGGSFENRYYYLMNDYVNFGYENDNYIYWWSLSPRGFVGNRGDAFYVNYFGNLSSDYVYSVRALRPSVSLKSSTRVIAGGEGTLAKPYVIG